MRRITTPQCSLATILITLALFLLPGELSAKSSSFLTGDSALFASVLDTLSLRPCGEIERTLEAELGALKKKYRPAAAYRLFEWFADAPVMGREEVAVWIAETFFLGETPEASDASAAERKSAADASTAEAKSASLAPKRQLLQCTQEQRFAMRSFVLMNRQSLIGMQAPELEMADTAGVKITLSQVEKEGEYTILFFYSTSCVKCRMASYKLAEFVNNYNKGVLNVFAVCTDSWNNSTSSNGADTQCGSNVWKEYINTHFYIYNPFVNWKDVSDPETESGYHLLYGVVETPKIFLLDRSGVIVGRNITVENLKELLQKRNEAKEQTDAFFKELFSQAKDEASVKALIDMMYGKVSEQKIFTEIFYELYMFLKYSEDYDLQCGAAYLGKKYIIDMPQRWNNPDFVEKVAVAVELFGRNPLGAVVKPLDLVLEGDVPFSLDDLQAQWRVLYFYNPSCGLCAEVAPQMKRIFEKFCENPSESSSKTDIVMQHEGVHEPFVEFVAINTGSDRAEWMKFILEQKADWRNAMSADEPARDTMFASYDLSGVPAIYLLDSKNHVVAKDINPQTLEGLLEYLHKK